MIGRLNFFTFLLIFISIIISPLSAFSYNEEFKDYTSAYTYWLGEKNLVETKGHVELSLGHFFALPQIALHDILSNPSSPWKVYYVSEYHFSTGEAIPPTLAPIQISKDGTIENVYINGHFFIYKNDINGPHLTVNFGSEYDFSSLIGTVNISYSSKDILAALELQNEIKQYAIEKNPYKNAVIHIASQFSYQFKFLENVNNFNFSWDDLILDKDTKDLTRQLTETFLSHFEEYKKLKLKSQFGVALAGPPGTGKSFLAQVLISSIANGALKDQTTFVLVTARHLQNPSGIKTLFSALKDFGSVCIFFEDIDLLGIKNRSNANIDAERAQLILNELLNGIDGVVENNNILLIGTTNRLDNVDDALLRSERFGFHLYFGLPSFSEREEFFNRFGRKKAVWAENLNSQWLAAKSEGFSGADIIEVIGIAKRFAYVKKSWQGDNLFLTQEFFIEAINLVKKDHKFSPLTSSINFKSKDKSYTKSLKDLLNQKY